LKHVLLLLLLLLLKPRHGLIQVVVVLLDGIMQAVLLPLLLLALLLLALLLRALLQCWLWMELLQWALPPLRSVGAPQGGPLPRCCLAGTPRGCTPRPASPAPPASTASSAENGTAVGDPRTSHIDRGKGISTWPRSHGRGSAGGMHGLGLAADDA